MKSLKLIDDGYCFVCGKKNKNGLHIEFRLSEDEKLECDYVASKEHQGFQNILHGGIIGLIMDEAMANLLWKLGKNAVTASYEVSLKKPVFTGDKLRFTAAVESEYKKIVSVSAECRNESGELMARAQAKCVKV